MNMRWMRATALVVMLVGCPGSGLNTPIGTSPDAQGVDTAVDGSAETADAEVDDGTHVASDVPSEVVADVPRRSSLMFPRRLPPTSRSTLSPTFPRRLLPTSHSTLLPTFPPTL